MGKLIIDRISKLSSLNDIRSDWEQLYKSDPNSQIFSSWLWQYGWFSTTSYKWVVLGVKNADTSSYVAFLPLTFYKRRSFGINTTRQIVFGGKPISIYSGFLCSTDFESRALHLLAKYIQTNLRWDNLRFEWLKDSRSAIFLEAFPDAKYAVELSNSLTSLRIELPDDYQIFLSKFINRNRRWELKSRSRFIKENESFNISYSSKKTIERDIDAICKLWFKRWGRKTEVELQRNMLHYLFKNDLLILTLLWDTKKPVSAHAFLVEPVKSSYLSYCIAYDPEYSKISPGIILVAEGIKNAIDNKYKYFDFTVGMDPYKLTFGPEQIGTKSIMIKRKNLKNTIKLIARKIKRVFN